jgi:hypothetical protein
MDRFMDICKDGQIEGLINKQSDRRREGQIDRMTDRHMEKQTDRVINISTDLF